MMKLNALISVTSLSLLFSSTIFAADLEYVRCLMPGEKAAVTIKQMMCAENGGKVISE